MKRITKGSMFTMVLLVVLTMTVSTPNAKAATPTQIDNAIANGLANLASRQYPDGHWETSYYVACTSMAVLAFENDGYHAGDGSIYATNVQKGLDYLFTTAYVQAIGVQPAGDPDTNGNGFGIYFNDPWGQVVYQTPMVLMAIVGSQSPSALATTGPANVIGRSYYNITQDIVDWLAWAQTDPAAGNRRGGWRYGPNYGDSDNSISQWPVLGLMAAELWGINAPAFVKTELAFWVTASQNLVGTPATNSVYGCFDYQPGAGFNSIAETAAGIMQLTYMGVAKTDPRIVAAEGYINRDWLTTYGGNGWRCNLGNFYAMYAVMKACRLATPTPIVFISNYDGTPGVEWYNGTNQYADILISHQYADGHWAQWVAPESIPQDLSTTFAELILEFVPVVVRFTLTVTVVDDTTNLPIPDATVTATGPDPDSPVSDITDDEGIAELTLQAGTYDVDISKPGYESKSLTVDLVGGDVEIPPSETRLPPSAPGPGVPEFGFSVTVFTALAAALYLALKKRYTK